MNSAAELRMLPLVRRFRLRSPSRSPRALVAGLALLLSLFPTRSPAWAAPSISVVEVEVAGCPSGETAELAAAVDILRAELATDGTRCCELRSSGADAPRRVHLAPLRCDGGADVDAAAHDVRSGHASQRRISLVDVAPEARPRVIALAVAEMVRGLGAPRASERAPAREAAQPPEPPGGATARAPVPAGPLEAAPRMPAPRPVPAGPPEAAPRMATAASAHLDLTGATRLYPQASTWVWGGELALALDRGAWRGLVAGALLGRDHEESAGVVALRSWWLSFGFARIFDVGPTRLFLGPVIEVGWGTVNGESRQAGVEAHDGEAWLVEMGLRAGARHPLGRGWELAATLGAGKVVRGLDAEVDGRRVMAVRGLALAASLGVGWGRPLR